MSEGGSRNEAIERVPVSALDKLKHRFRCQFCEALGQDHIGFKSRTESLIEAHRVMPILALEVGSLAASHDMMLCANHHQDIDYGSVRLMVLDEISQASINGQVFTMIRDMAPARAA
ncbi:hypothetical protein [Methylobacterium bullatum]|uniref:HNH nuclease domain-containing protein n=1 Tax=Methylobacterium bullatum TaxID=570505 RepID=A0AAV4Z8R3_9HYPH|nr:hypothetical protein [Methylobacterium bullatum]MBD8902828.1 hypothetical protein [Methylobacterium bullatum]GJD39929.1 hypothetical protein OICFNHDK_2393 [Methylobacterium bullatum]